MIHLAFWVPKKFSHVTCQASLFIPVCSPVLISYSLKTDNKPNSSHNIQISKHLKFPPVFQLRVVSFSISVYASLSTWSAIRVMCTAIPLLISSLSEQLDGEFTTLWKLQISPWNYFWSDRAAFVLRQSLWYMCDYSESLGKSRATILKLSSKLCLVLHSTFSLTHVFLATRFFTR